MLLFWSRATGLVLEEIRKVKLDGQFGSLSREKAGVWKHKAYIGTNHRAHPFFHASQVDTVH
jgi:hypothetical protein